MTSRYVVVAYLEVPDPDVYFIPPVLVPLTQCLYYFDHFRIRITVLNLASFFNVFLCSIITERKQENYPGNEVG